MAQRQIKWLDIIYFCSESWMNQTIAASTVIQFCHSGLDRRLEEMYYVDGSISKEGTRIVPHMSIPKS